MISLTLYLQHKDDEYRSFTVEAKRDGDGDLRIEFMRMANRFTTEDVGVYLRPDLACKLRDRLNVLFPAPEPELIKLREPEASEVTK